MSDLQEYIEKRKKTDKEFSINFDKGYEQFKIGVMLRQIRKSASLPSRNLQTSLIQKRAPYQEWKTMLRI